MPAVTGAVAAAGTTVLIDSTIFVYHFTAASEDCRAFLARCESGRIEGITSAAVIAEVTHRLMTVEAVMRGLVTPGNVARKLAEKPEIVRMLSQYERDAEAIALMGVRIVTLDLPALLRGGELRAAHGLMTNDSLVAAAALDEAGGRLASADTAFDIVPGLELHSPRDLNPPRHPRKG